MSSADEQFNAYHKWLGIPLKEQPPNHYRLLGIEIFESDPDVIEAAADRQMSFVRQYATGPQSDISQELLNELSAAQVCLLVPESKTDYDKQLKQKLARKKKQAAPPTKKPVPDAEKTANEKTKRPEKQSRSESKVSSILQNPKLIRNSVAVVAVLALLWIGIAVIGMLGGKTLIVTVDDSLKEGNVAYILDEQSVALADLESGVRVDPGLHQLIIKRDDEEIYKHEFEVTDDSDPLLNIESDRTGKISSTLIKQLDDEPLDLADDSAGEIMTLEGHKRDVLTLAFSSTGRYLVSGGYDSTVRVWDLKDQSELRSFQPGYQVSSLAISPDGKSLVCNGDRSPTFRLWDLNTGKPIRTFEGHAAPITSVDFSQDGTRIASGASQPDGSVRVWDTETAKSLWEFSIHKSGATNVSFSPDGKSVIASLDGIPMTFDAETGRRLKLLDAYAPMHFASGGTHVVAKGAGNLPQLWDANKGVELHEYEDIANMNRLAVAPNGLFAATGTSFKKDGFLYVWNLQSAKEVAKFQVKRRLNCIAFSDDSKMIAIGADKNAIKVFRLPESSTDESASTVVAAADATQDSDDVGAVRKIRWGGSFPVAADQGRVATVQGGYVKVWNVISGELLFKSRNHQATQATITRGGKYVVSTNSSNLHLWEVDTGHELNRMTFPGEAVRNLSIGDDCRHVAAAIQVNRMLPNTIAILFDAITGAEVRRWGDSASQFRSVTLSTDGQKLAIVEDTTITLFDVNTGAEIRKLEGHAPSGNYAAVNPRVSFSRNGRFLLSFGADRTVRVWNTETGEQTVKLSQNTTINAAMLTAWGEHVFLNSDKFKMVDVAASRESEPFSDGPTAVNSISISPDGKYAATTSSSSYALDVWRLPKSAATLAYSATDDPVLGFGERGGVIRFKAHELEVRDVAFSPDSNQLMSISTADGEIRLWDSKQGKSLRSFKTGESGVYTAIFSADGSSVISGHLSGAIHEWSLETEKKSTWTTGHHGAISSFAMSADGSMLVSTGSDSSKLDASVRLWDVKSGQEKWKYEWQNKRASSAAILRDGASVLAEVDGNIMLFNTSTGQRIRQLDGFDIAVASDDGAIIATGDTNAIHVWDAESGRLIRQLRAAGQIPRDMAFSKDGRLLAVCGSGIPNIRVWEVATGRQVLQWAGDLYRIVSTVTFSPDGSTIAFGESDGSVGLWKLPVVESTDATVVTSSGDSIDDAAVGQIRKNWLPGGAPNSATISQDGKRIGLIHAYTAKVWDVETEELLFRIRDIYGLYNIALSPDGSTIATRSRSAIVTWDTATGKQIKSIEATNLTAFGFSADARLALAVVASKKRKPGKGVLYDITSGDTLLQLDGVQARRNQYLQPTFTADASRIALPSGNDIRILETKTGKQISNLRVGGKSKDYAVKMVFSTDGQSLFAATYRGKYIVWDVNTADIKNEIVVRGGIALLPDGRYATASAKGLQLYNDAGEATSLMPASLSRTIRFAAVPNSSLVLSTGDDSMLRLWRLPSANP